MNILAESYPSCGRLVVRELDFIRKKVGTVRLLSFIQRFPFFIGRKMKHTVAILALQDILSSQHGFEQILEQIDRGCISSEEIDELIVMLLRLRRRCKRKHEINCGHV